MAVILFFRMKPSFCPSLSILFMVALLLFGGCDSKRSRSVDPEFSRYISAFTSGNVSTDAFIQVELAQEIPAVELNAEIKETLFSFSPSLKGHAFWVNANTVRFMPDAGQLKPGKEYRVTFHLGKLLQVDKKFQQFRFFTRVHEQNFTAEVLPYSPMSGSDLTWNGVEVLLNLSNPIAPEQAAQLFDVKGARGYRVRATTAGATSYRVMIDSLQRTNKPEQYMLTINGRTIGSKKRIEQTIDLPPFSTDHFQVVDVRVVQEGDPHIRVTFSDPVSQRQELQGLIVPSGVNHFTYRIDKNAIKIYPESFPKGELTLQVHQGIQNSGGLTLDKTYQYQLQIQDDKPRVRFEKSGNILPNAERLLLPFSAVNLWAVDVQVVKIYQNNLLYYLQSSSLNDDPSSGELRRFGRLVMKKRIRLDSDKALDLTKWNYFNIDLSEMIKRDPGAFYMVRLSMQADYSLFPCNGTRPRIPEEERMKRFSNELLSKEDEAVWDQAISYYYDPLDWDVYDWEERNDPCKPSYYMNRERTVETLVMASNVGLIAKAGQGDRLSVVVTDILSTQPLTGAEVTLYNYQMQVIGTGKSDANGFTDIDYKGGRPFLVTATTRGGDMGYLEVKEEASLSLSRFDVSGKEVQEGLKGYVYTERGVWRPGDSLYVSFILEDKEKRLPEKHPVTLEVYTPRGQFYQRQVKSEGVNGFYTFIVTTDPAAETGMWQARVKVGGTTFYKPLRVETIKPNRLRVRLETDSIIDATGGAITGRLTSRWLHGAPASNLKAEVDLTLTVSDNPFGGYPGYTFNNPVVQFETSQTKLFEGVLDATGAATVSTQVPVAENAPGMLRGNILSRVYEGGGDMSFYGQTVYYSPYRSYVGVQPPATRIGQFLETDVPTTFNVAMVNPFGKPVAGNVEYRVYKLSWSWWWDSSGEDLGSYVNSTAANVVATGEVSLTQGKGKIDFQVDYPDWGRYLLLVKDREGDHTAGTIFYVDWPSWRGRSAKGDPEGLTMLTFTTDKPSYDVGEVATVILPKSSQGRALITVENGSGILQREWVKTSTDTDTKYTIKVTDKMAPNFYVFATMLQPHSQTVNDLPIRLYGVVNVGVENSNSFLNPVIQMPETLQPEKEFTVSVSEKTRKPMTYTLAIVDEGLLDLTSFKTPNAWGEFYAREALGVRTWDLFDRVLGASSGAMGPLLGIGGDEALKPSRDNVNRFKPVVKFIGPFALKGGETKAHTLRLPQYVGSVRVMVVAGGGGAYGSAEKTVAVKSDLMTLSTLPRVLGPGEEVWLPVNLFAEKSVRNVQVTIKTGGLLTVVDKTTQTLSFDEPGDDILFFKLRSGKRTGAEKVVIQASGDGVSFTETIDIAIRNPNIPTVITRSRLVEPGETARLEVETGNVEPGDWATLELSRLPSVNFSRNINYLLEYPHGCTEQITSRGFPLLYIDKFTTLNDEEKQRASATVVEVIRQISSRQLADGGFMFWYGDHYSAEWSTTYAGHFLIEAMNRGYEVPEAVMSRWVQFQVKLAQNWLPTNPNLGYYRYSMIDLQQAYRLYTLALSGNAELGAMNRLRELPSLSLQARWRLAAAYAVAGRKEVANALVFNATDEVEEYSFNNDTYGSSARDQAMILETYLLLDNLEKAMQLAPSVANSLSSSYITTQTASFGLVAMAQLAERIGDGNIDADWSLNGKAMKRVNTPMAIHQETLEPGARLSVDLTNNGEGALYTRLSARTVPAADAELEPKQGRLRLSVRYVGLDGKPLEVKSLAQGNEFMAIVTVYNSVEQPFTDLALMQLFPSGWEIFNERMLDEAAADTDGGYNYRDIRDDRVLTYFNLGTGQSKSFRVRLQAAYRGKFYLPAVSCQAMYAPGEEARNSGTWVTVE